MPVNFLNNECQTILNATRFGLCDDVDIPPAPPTPAYAIAYFPDTWIATVDNPGSIPVQFTAVDHCAIYAEENAPPRPMACDGMLTYQNTIIFVELKERRMNRWWEEGLEQLRVTIEIYEALHGLDNFTTKRAYLSNKTKPDFQFSSRVTKEQFQDQTGFELFPEIIIPIN